MARYAVLFAVGSLACGDDSTAVQRGIGAACASSAECTEMGQMCLTQFRGGMCGIADCTASSQCPAGSVCVSDPDLARNFCLLTCLDKPDCNVHRSVEVEANCSSTLNQLDPPEGGTGPKVCRPPNS